MISGADHPKERSVLLAMSGGVDSSAAAKLLLDEGFHVLGATMALLEGECVEANAARQVSESLGIEHVTFDLRKEFQDGVIRPFCNTYIEGRTPNPCVVCNKYLKFGILHQKREEMGLDLLATGHYARIGYDAASDRWQLLRARDYSKDQSYFLYNVTQDQFAHTIFPLGNISKKDVRVLAKDAEIPTAERQESQDICFIKEGDHVEFIERFANAHKDLDMKSCFDMGDIVDLDGNVLGQHNGLIYYTVGQRKGIGVAAARPLYVIGKDPANNRLIVGYASDALVRAFTVDDVNMVSAGAFDSDKAYTIKSHYRQEPVPAIVSPACDGTIEVTLDEPCRPTSAGQSLVVYDGDTVIAGGVIA